jgi:hypothetical protein
MRTYKIVYSRKWDEWIVKCYVNGKHYRKGDYHTNDKYDAQMTKLYMESLEMSFKSES